MSVTRIWVLSCYVVSVDVCLHFEKKQKKTLSRAPLMSRALGKCPVALMVNPALITAHDLAGENWSPPLDL